MNYTAIIITYLRTKGHLKMKPSFSPKIIRKVIIFEN